MAIAKSIESKYGANATYWKIVSILVDGKNEIASATLYGYLDHNARTEHPEAPLMIVSYYSKHPAVPSRSILASNDYAAIIAASAPIVSTIYGHFKSMAEFAGCTDC